MTRRTSYFSDKPKTSKLLVTLNVVIIVLIVTVLSLLILYGYTFFTGKSPLMDIGIEMPWDNELVVTTNILVIEPEPTEITTSATTAETPSVTVNVTVDNVSETSVSTEPTEPKYSSDDYDKEFFSNSLFIGDSIFTGFSGFGYLQPENVFAKVGLNPESAVTREIDGVTAVGKAQQMQPDRICIMLGTNGLAFLSADYMANEMAELVDNLRTVSPDSEIIILSIPPVTAEHESSNPETIPVIMDYNSKLEETAKDRECRFIDIFTMLQDDDGYLAADYAEADGLHFLGKAYGVVLSRIQYELEQDGAQADVKVTDISEETDTSALESSGILDTSGDAVTAISAETAVSPDTSYEAVINESELIQ